jgi:elongation factor G
MKLEVVTPEPFLGDVIGDLNSRRAQVESVETYGEIATIYAFMPLAEAFGYATAVRSKTQGRATHSMEFYQYQELPASLLARVTDKVGSEYA